MMHIPLTCPVTPTVDCHIFELEMVASTPLKQKIVRVDIHFLEDAVPYVAIFPAMYLRQIPRSLHICYQKGRVLWSDTKLVIVSITTIDCTDCMCECICLVELVVPLGKAWLPVCETYHLVVSRSMTPKLIITYPICDVIVALITLYLRVMDSTRLLLVPYQVPSSIKQQDFVVCRSLAMRA